MTTPTRYRCTRAPMGDHGLEGYELGQTYPVVWLDDSRGKGRPRIAAVYPDPEYSPGYYETTSAGILARYFEPVGPE